jgi:simple sugar transport system permease protein
MNSLIVDALIQGVVLGTPLALAGLGELVAERAGIINLGVEGMMLLGAVIGFIVAVQTDNLFLAFLAAGAVATALALIHAVMTITFRVNQIVMGLVLTVLGTGLAAYIGAGWGDQNLQPLVSDIAIPGLAEIPQLGEIFFDQDIFVYLAPATAIAIAVAMARTSWGLWLRATGESPAAADAAGVPVFAVRYAAVLFGGFMAGIAGAYLSVVFTRTWTDGLTAGRGWIAIALVIFASWRPILILPGALLFGFIDALNFQLQAEGVAISRQLLAMMPYLFTLAALCVVVLRQRKRPQGMPAAIGYPYDREAREQRI